MVPCLRTSRLPLKHHSMLIFLYKRVQALMRQNQRFLPYHLPLLIHPPRQQQRQEEVQEGVLPPTSLTPTVAACISISCLSPNSTYLLHKYKGMEQGGEVVLRGVTYPQFKRPRGWVQVYMRVPKGGRWWNLRC